MADEEEESEEEKGPSKLSLQDATAAADQLSLAISGLMSYSESHPVNRGQMAQTRETLTAMAAEFGEIELGVGKRSFESYNAELRLRDPKAGRVSTHLRMHKLTGIVFSQGVTGNEIDRLVTTLAQDQREVANDGGLEAVLLSKRVTHIRVFVGETESAAPAAPTAAPVAPKLPPVPKKPAPKPKPPAPSGLPPGIRRGGGAQGEDEGEDGAEAVETTEAVEPEAAEPEPAEPEPVEPEPVEPEPEAAEPEPETEAAEPEPLEATTPEPLMDAEPEPQPGASPLPVEELPVAAPAAGEQTLTGQETLPVAAAAGEQTLTGQETLTGAGLLSAEEEQQVVVPKAPPGSRTAVMVLELSDRIRAQAPDLADVDMDEFVNYLGELFRTEIKRLVVLNSSPLLLELRSYYEHRAVGGELLSRTRLGVVVTDNEGRVAMLANGEWEPSLEPDKELPEAFAAAAATFATEPVVFNSIELVDVTRNANGTVQAALFLPLEA
jgi:hypothetical protein